MESANSDARDKVRQQLNRDKVKLWLPPYTADDGSRGECPDELISRYSIDLCLPVDVISTVIEELRLHSLSRLTADRRYRETGVAVLKVRFAGHIPSSLLPEITVETSLRVTSFDFKHQLSRTSGLAVECIRLISSGLVLQDGSALEDQHVKHNSTLMALCLSPTEATQLQEQERAARVAKARQAAELISSRTENDADRNYYMQITNQSGQTLDLPDVERKALTMAMVLHEKGRTAIKRRDFGEALVFLLEADSEFKKCSASILGTVDNYGLLCLDTVWCYLCLQNISALPDAEVRLRTCEDCFNRSYGQNLERLAHVKGNTGEERALLLRLHLLQGILAFIQRRNDDAWKLLRQAEQELKMLKTNEEDMMQVMEMGFSETEARLGLRSCGGNVQNAVAHIMQKREEKMKQIQQDKEERAKKRLAKKLGKTNDGKPVNVDHYNSLVSMGFKKGAAAESLRQSNNDIALSFQILHEKPELLNLPDPDTPSLVEITDEMMTEVAAMGFDVEMARAALNHCGADVTRAVDELIRLGGIVPPEWIQALHSASSTNSSTSMTTASSASLASSQTSQEQEEERRQQERELIEEIIPDIPKDSEDYLDVVLDDEAAMIQEYIAKLSSLDQSSS